MESNTATTLFPANENIQHRNDKPNTTLPVELIVTDDTLINALTHRVFDVINYVILSGLIGLFGTVANVINMLVFLRIGIFTSVSNLNLFSLAIADFGVAFTIFLQSIGYALITIDLRNLKVDMFDVVYITISWPNMIFVMANRLISTFVAFERCMCVIIPFKVKTLFTIQRSVTFLFLLFTYSFASHIPIFVTHNLQFVVQENNNASKLILVFLAHSDLFYDICINTNVFFISFVTVILVLIFTLITVSQIKLSSEWRKSVSNSSGNIVKKDQTSTVENCSQSENSTHDIETSMTNDDSDNGGGTIKKVKMTNKTIDKETRLVKMITLVSIIYMILYMPEMVMIIVMFVDKRISTYGQYWRLSEVLYSFTYPTGALNSSINILVYYKMSSAFRREFRKLFKMAGE